MGACYSIAHRYTQSTESTDTHRRTQHVNQSHIEHSLRRHTQTIIERAETQRDAHRDQKHREGREHSAIQTYEFGFHIARSPARSSLTGPPISPTCLPKRQSAQTPGIFPKLYGQLDCH